jgi:hypothetical protein
MSELERGLIKREIVGSDKNAIHIRELWDVTVPGCPIVAVKLAPEFGIDKDVEIVERAFWVSRSHIKSDNEK